MKLRDFGGDARAFSARVGPFLVAHEAAHGLILGLTGDLIHTPEHFAAPPYLASVDESGAVVAVALRTPPHNLILSVTEHPAALAVIAADLHRAGVTLSGAIGPTASSLAFAEAWCRLTGHSFRCVMSQRIYQVERVIAPRNVPGALRPAIAADLDLLYAWSLAFHAEAEAVATGGVDPRVAREHIDTRFNSPTSGLVLWWDGGRPVALAGYTGPTLTGIRIGPVYTPPEYRRRGYASAATAALSQHLLDRGRRRCFLSTDLANPTSNGIYQTIGYEPVCDVENYRFEFVP